MTGTTLVAGTTFAMRLVGTPIRGSGWTCAQCCVLAPIHPIGIVLAFLALLTAGSGLRYPRT